MVVILVSEEDDEIDVKSSVEPNVFRLSTDSNWLCRRGLFGAESVSVSMGGFPMFGFIETVRLILLGKPSLGLLPRRSKLPSVSDRLAPAIVFDALVVDDETIGLGLDKGGSDCWGDGTDDERMFTIKMMTTKKINITEGSPNMILINLFAQVIVSFFEPCFGKLPSFMQASRVSLAVTTSLGFSSTHDDGFYKKNRFNVGQFKKHNHFWP